MIFVGKMERKQEQFLTKTNEYINMYFQNNNNIKFVFEAQIR